MVATAPALTVPARGSVLPLPAARPDRVPSGIRAPEGAWPGRGRDRFGGEGFGCHVQKVGVSGVVVGRVLRAALRAVARGAVDPIA
ncbi:hypothetical protein SNE510_58140 [Streptomyces sp. NE5-10]|nr:hypothetical protein SNE510_58140 [Streptomyces sp. NE5-10]